MSSGTVNPFSPPAEAAVGAAAVDGTDFTISADDFAAAYWLHLRPRPWAIALSAALGVLGMSGLVLAALNSRARLSLLLLFLGFWLLFCLLSGPRRMRKLHAQMPWMALEQSLSLVDDRLILHNDWVTARIPIEAIKAIKRNRRLALVYVGAPVFYVIKTEAPAIAAIMDDVDRRRAGA